MSARPVTPAPAPFDVRGSIFNVRRSTLPAFPIFLALLSLTLPNAKSQDTIILKNGRKADCRILDFTADAAKISYRPAPDAPAADRLIPLTDIDYVELAPLPGEPEALAQAIREGRSEPLITFWVKRLPWLNRPRTNGGEIGLTYAELLTRVPTADRMERALKIYQQIENADWSAGRRGRAQAGRLRVMLRQGRTEEVRPLAESLLQQNGDPRVLIELRHVLAEAAAAALTKLEKDHPRWQEEDDLLPKHAALLNESLDGYLFPHLFHGAEEDLAARGLQAAAQLSAAQKRTAEAAEWFTDLTQLYATTPEAAVAKTWLEKQPAPAVIAKPTPAPEATEEADPDETETTEAEEPAPAKAKPKPRAKSEKKSTPRPKAKPKTSEAGDE